MMHGAPHFHRGPQLLPPIPSSRGSTIVACHGAEAIRFVVRFSCARTLGAWMSEALVI
jgi:hypothetical protein